MKSSRPGSGLATGIAAIVLVVLLTAGAVLAFAVDQVFLGVIGGIGALLTGWAFVSARKAA